MLPFFMDFNITVKTFTGSVKTVEVKDMPDEDAARAEAVALTFGKVIKIERTDSEVDEDTDPCSPTASSFTRITRSSKQTVSFESAPSAKAATELGSWQTYGKGWLLKPTKNHSKYGEKIYRGGWWMPKHSAWFFKQSVAEKL